MALHNTAACARCKHAMQALEASGVHACRSCGTEFAEMPAVRSLMADAGVALEILTEMARGSGVARAPCAGCGLATAPVTLKGVAVEFCRACGGMWLDPGERHRLSRGRQGQPVPMTMAPSSPVGLPGAYAPGRLVAFVGESSLFTIKQKVHTSEWVLGVERANQYTVDCGAQVGIAQEEGGGITGVLLRQLLRSRRPMRLVLSDGNMQPILRTHRPFRFFTSRMNVEDANGRALGSVEQSFTVVTRHYTLRDARERTFAEIRSGFWKPWTFPVTTLQGRPLAMIRKHWSGFFREAWTEADRFTLQLAEAPLEMEQRAVLLATALSIDMDYFESGNRGGALRLLGS